MLAQSGTVIILASLLCMGLPTTNSHTCFTAQCADMGLEGSFRPQLDDKCDHCNDQHHRAACRAHTTRNSLDMATCSLPPPLLTLSLEAAAAAVV